MALNGIDTASYQAGLDPHRVPMDFNIVKATQGVSYTNPDFRRMAEATVDAGKLLGIYHYAEGIDPVREADFFLRTISGYVGKAVLCLDWEGEQNPKFGKEDVKWCKAFCDHVKAKTGVCCFIYMSKSVCRAHNWQAVAADYPLWCAQYAGNSRTGYQSEPWTDSKGFGAWARPLIYQYSSAGMLPGWNARLDLDIAYLTKEEWATWANGAALKPPEDKFPDKSDNDLAVEVMFQIHGNDDARREALGARYSRVQACVEKFYAEGKGLTNYQVALLAYLKRWGCSQLI